MKQIDVLIFKNNVALNADSDKYLKSHNKAARKSWR